MKMKKQIFVAGILAAALLAGGCGKFVRDELITMQNEIDLLYGQVDQMNKGLGTLQGIVSVMAANGYIVDVKEIQDEDRGGYVLSFRTVTLDANGNVAAQDDFQVKLYSGVDGKDAIPYVVSAKKDDEDGRWYWWHADEDADGNPTGEWLLDENGNKIPLDGKTPALSVNEEGYWCVSWDGGEPQPTDWKAKGQDAFEIFTKAEVFEDRVELTLASDGSVIVLPRFLPVDVALTLNDQELPEQVLIAPGETLAIRYVLSGTGAEAAILVAGTDGRFKTALRPESATEGTVEVTCPDVFPEGGYVSVIVNDGNGRSDVRVIRFAARTLRLLYGEAAYAAPAVGETGVMLTFESNFDLDAAGVFPEGVEPWLTVKMETVEGIPVLTYDVAANAAPEARTGVIVVSPKDHPGFEVFRVTVTQAAAPETTGSGV